MGYGGYSYEAHRAITEARSGQTPQQLFTQSKVHPKMLPKGVKARECRDSPDHPASLGICFALDVSGSMGEIPQRLAREELPTFMKTLMDCGVADPQILFMAFVDARYDPTPLQVGQFESTADLMDQWLTRTFMGASPGSAYTGAMPGGESYETALWFAARHTAMDCWEKRKKKGYLFMTGDEDSYAAMPREVCQNVLGYDVQADVPLEDVMKAVRETWKPYFLVPDPARAVNVAPFWERHFGRDLIVMQSPADTCGVAASLVALGEGLLPDRAALEKTLATAIGAERAATTLTSLGPWLAGR